MKFIIACLLVVVLVGCANHSHQQPQAVVQTKPVPSPLLNSHSALIQTNLETVYVAGEVTYPGRIIWRPGLTLTKAIALAGGFTDFADQRRLEVRSLGGAVKDYDYHLVESAVTDYPLLKPGDYVRVGRRNF